MSSLFVPSACLMEVGKDCSRRAWTDGNVCVGLGDPVELVIAVEGDEQSPGGGVGAGVGQAKDQPEHGTQAQHLSGG